MFSPSKIRISFDGKLINHSTYTTASYVYFSLDSRKYISVQESKELGYDMIFLYLYQSIKKKYTITKTVEWSYINLKIYYKDMPPHEAKHCYLRKTNGLPLCGLFSIMLYRDLCEMPAVIEFDLLIASFPFPNKKTN